MLDTGLPVHYSETGGKVIPGVAGNIAKYPGLFKYSLMARRLAAHRTASMNSGNLAGRFQYCLLENSVQIEYLSGNLNAATVASGPADSWPESLFAR